MAAAILQLAWPAGARAGPSSPAETAGPVLTESEAVERALANLGLDDRLSAHVDKAEADRLDVGRWPNPRVSYTREQLLGSAATGTDFLVLSQAVDVSGHRYLERKAARTRVESAEIENAAARADVVARTRVAYAEALYAQEQLALLEHWRAAIAQVVNAADARAAAGDLSRFDAARSVQELRVLEARIASARGLHLRAWAGLRATMAGESPADPVPLAGPLLPASPSTSGSIETSPRLRAIETELKAAATQTRAARRAWVPPLQLSLGYKGERDAGSARRHGFTAGASIALPLGSRGQEERRRADAEATRLRGDASLARQELEARDVELRARLDALSAGLVGGSSDELPALAKAVYESGEIGITQALDAYRGTFEAESAARTLALEIRMAHIELDRLAGRTKP